jgi:hypothetical protein
VKGRVRGIAGRDRERRNGLRSDPEGRTFSEGYRIARLAFDTARRSLVRIGRAGGGGGRKIGAGTRRSKGASLFLFAEDETPAKGSRNGSVTRPEMRIAPQC